MSALVDVAGEAIPLLFLLAALVVVPRWARRDATVGTPGDLEAARKARR